MWNSGLVRALLISEHFNDEAVSDVATLLPGLAKLGVNALILEVNYHFEFKRHPNLRHPYSTISAKAANRFAHRARDVGIEVIPLFQVLGNQSDGSVNSPLLAQYPEFDATPGSFSYNAGIHSREWDPMNEKVDRIIFSLIDELIEAFSARSFHIGLGEIFLLGHPRSPSTHDKHPAVVFAYVANVYRQFLIYRRNVNVLMWGDRLINGNEFDFGPWESSMNDTWEAVDLIPRDVIVCPWHYKPRDSYPSIPMLTEKGFRVLPMCWSNFEATADLIRFCNSLNNEKLSGFLFSSWNIKTDDLLYFKPLLEGLKLLEQLEGKWKL